MLLEHFQQSFARKVVSSVCAIFFLFSQQPYLAYASGISADFSDGSSKLVVDCSEITSDEAQESGGKIGEFIKEELLGCDKSLSTVNVVTKADSGTVSAGLFLIGTDGTDTFGKNSSTRYEASISDITINGVPKVTAVKSNTGRGAELLVKEVRVRHSTMATEATGVYTFGVYGYVSALVPTDGGVGYEDIQSVELDWSGVTATGKYHFTNPKTNKTVTREFTFSASGTSSIAGTDLTFKTKKNTTSGHCVKTASNDYSCYYADSYKDILRMADVANVDGTVSCSGIKDFITKNPELEDRFVCKKAGVVVDCESIELTQETAVCKNKSGNVVDCSEVKNKNACYKTGSTARDYGYTCWRGGEEISCTDLGFDGECPTVCKLNGSEVSCNEVINKNACSVYNIYTDKLGYTCEAGGKTVACSTLGKGTCDIELKCNYGTESIECSRYQNALACSSQYGFEVSGRYWCQRGNVQVSCEDITPASSCDLSSVVCKDVNQTSPISCDVIRNYNACASHGTTSADYIQYACTFDEATISCSNLPTKASSSCPLTKECNLVESLGYNVKLDCEAMENALQCGNEGWGDYAHYYTCSIGTTPVDCLEDIKAGTCNLNVCSSSCPYLGVSLDGTAETCICLPEPVCSGSLDEQSGTNKCAYGGTPTGNGTRSCACDEKPTCSTGECLYGGVPKADGTQDCTCNAAPDCSLSCAYGGEPKGDGTQDCSCNEPPDCQTKCTYGGEVKEGECSCNPEPICTGALVSQTGTNKCEYGGTPLADGTMACLCNSMPSCLATCPEYGGTPVADGTDSCVCNPAPSTHSVASTDFSIELIGGKAPELPTVEIYDEGGSGTGATGTLNFTRTIEKRAMTINLGEMGTMKVTATAHVLSITGITITNAGTGYVSPKIRLVGTTGHLNGDLSDLGSWIYETKEWTFGLNTSE